VEAAPPLVFAKQFLVAAQPKVLGARLGWQGSKPNQGVVLTLGGEAIKSKVFTQVTGHANGCPLGKEEFLSTGGALPQDIIDRLVADARARCFSTGSLGWFATRTETVQVGKIEVRVVLQFQAVLKGTKPIGSDAPTQVAEGAPMEEELVEEEATLPVQSQASGDFGQRVRGWLGCRKRQIPEDDASSDDDAPLAAAPSKKPRTPPTPQEQNLDAKLLKLAQELSQDGILDLADAKKLWNASAKWGVKDKEARTLQHLMSDYAFTEEGLCFLSSTLARNQAPKTSEAPTASCAAPPSGDFVPVFFNPGNAGFEELAGTLRSAKKTLDLCLFTISDDRLSQIVLDVHAAGVKVRLITDDDMHQAMKTSDVASLQKAGIQVRFDRKKVHMHHKFVLVDDELCVHGSLNWSTGALRNNRENIIITRSDHIIESFAAEFERLWAAFAPKAAIDTSLAPNCAWKDDVLAMFFPDQEDHNFAQLFDVVSSAKSTLDVAVFTLTVPELIEAIKDAHQRGARVRVITDDRQAKFACKGKPFRDLQAAGVEVRTDRSPANMHHKFCVVDGRILCNGSYNWTRQGEDGNYENLVVYRNHADLTTSFSREFESLWAQFAP